MTQGKVGAISMFVSDIERSTEFYLRVFDTQPVFSDDVSTALSLGNLIVNLLLETEAPEVIEPATVAPANSGARVLLTFNVEDTDATVAEFTARGVTLINGPIDRPWGQRTAAFADPDGHLWEIASDVK